MSTQDQVKASLLRGLIAELNRAGLYPQVLEAVDAPTRERLRSPPPASSWIDGSTMTEVGRACTQVASVQRWRQLNYLAARNGVAPLLQTMLQGMLRAFGATPATLLSRMELIAASTQRGARFEYTPSSSSSGTLVQRYPTRRDVPAFVFEGSAGALAVVFDTCGVRGSVEGPVYLEEPARNAVRMEFRWGDGARGGSQNL